MIRFPSNSNPLLMAATVFLNGVLVVGGAACVCLVGAAGIGAVVFAGALTGVYQ